MIYYPIHVMSGQENVEICVLNKLDAEVRRFAG